MTSWHSYPKVWNIGHAGVKDLYVISPEIFQELDIFGTHGPLLLINVPDITVWRGPGAPGCHVYIPFQDPANVGAILRSAINTPLGEVVPDIVVYAL